MGVVSYNEYKINNNVQVYPLVHSNTLLSDGEALSPLPSGVTG